MFGRRNENALQLLPTCRKNEEAYFNAISSDNPAFIADGKRLVQNPPRRQTQ